MQHDQRELPLQLLLLNLHVILVNVRKGLREPASAFHP